MRRIRRALRTLADYAVAVTVTLAPVLFPRSLDDPHAPRTRRTERDDSDNGRGSDV